MIARRPLRLALALSLAVAVPLQALAQQPSTDPYYDFLLGQRLESEGDETGALAAMERAAAAAPTSAHIRAEIASLYLGLNQPAAAEKAALAALALDEGSTEAHQVLGMLMSASPDRMKEGITHLEKVMATPAGATDISLQFTLGRLYLVTGAVEKSVDLLTKIVEEQPYLMQARLTLVQALQSAGRGDEAIEYLAPVAGSDARLNTTLAGLLTRAGRAREAADRAPASCVRRKAGHCRWQRRENRQPARRRHRHGQTVRRRAAGCGGSRGRVAGLGLSRRHGHQRPDRRRFAATQWWRGLP